MRAFRHNFGQDKDLYQLHFNICKYVYILNKIKCNRITDCIYYYLKSPNCRGEFISRNIAIGNAIKPRIAMMKKLLMIPIPFQVGRYACRLPEYQRMILYPDHH